MLFARTHSYRNPPLLMLALLVFTLHADRLAAQSVKVDTKAIDAVVEKEMKAQKIAGLAIAIIGNNKVVYSKGYGFSNLENQTSVNENTVFNWASNSKPLIAIAAMQLVQSGELDLNASVKDYVPSVPDEWKEITTKHLLCHQSGIPHYHNGKIVGTGTKVTPQQELDPLNSLHRFGKSPLIFSPGSKHEYSSYAYVLLTAVVQAAGKKPIAQQIDNRIIVPLKMSSFQLDVALDGQANWSTGYRNRNGKTLAVEDYSHAWKHGAGAYKSNIEDFAKFGIGVMKNRLIKTKTSATMWTAQKIESGEKTGFGLGVGVAGKGQTLRVSHSGSQDEASTRLVLYPRQKHGIALLSNTNGADPGKITTAIYKVLVAK